MAQPTTGAFEPREDLGMRYDEFSPAMNRMGYIGHLVMPIVQRSKPDGKFPRVPLEQMLQNLQTQRNPDGTYKRSSREWEDDSYETAEYGLEAMLDDRTIARYDDIIDAEAFESEVLEAALLGEYEKAVAALLFNTSTFSGRTAGVSNEWDDFASATPIVDINNAVNAVRTAAGVKPNALIINDFVFRNLINCAQIVDRLKYQGFQDARPGEISRAALASALNIDQVIVAGGLKNTKAPGVAAVLADIWDKEYALVAKVATSTNPNEVCIGRTIQWSQEGTAGPDGMAVIAETYYEDARRGGVLRRRTDWGLKKLHIECGYLLSNITT